MQWDPLCANLRVLAVGEGLLACIVVCAHRVHSPADAVPSLEEDDLRVHVHCLELARSYQPR